MEINHPDSTTDPPSDKKAWLTPPEAAAYLRIHPRTLGRWRHDGRIRAYKTQDGRSVRYRRTDLDAALVLETPLTEHDGPAQDRPTGPGYDHLIQA